MRILLDTHVALAVLWQSLTRQYPLIALHLADPSTFGFVSVATLWEMAIKVRLGKLDVGMPLDHVAGYLQAVGLTILSIEASHVVAAADPEPETRDPFARLLLAQCQVENLRLVTVDRALASHQLALSV
jgi:PIN domain nuclease of toxin-antitoxin system